MSNPKYRDVSSGSKYLVILELFVLATTLYSTFYLNDYFSFIKNVDTPQNILAVYAISFSLVIQLSALALGLYNSKLREGIRGVMRRLLVSVAVAFFFLALINPFYGDKALSIELLAVNALASFIVIAILRTIVVRIGFFGLNKRKVLIIGAGNRASIIERRMRRDVDRQHFDLHGFVISNGDCKDTGIKNENCIDLDVPLVTYVLEHDIDEIVIANDERRNSLPVDDLFACKVKGVNIIELLDFIERETGQIAVDLIYPSWLIYSTGFASTHELRDALDWIFNASIAIVLFIFTAPIMLLTMIIMKLDEGMKAPIFYCQERVGLDGESFSIVKFRSMRVDAEKNGAQMASENDDRTTRIGHFLRKYRIDELPQIYNVLRGEMGFVGPRPERPEFVQGLIKSLPYYNERHNVKPGLTGWAQLKYPYGASEADSLEKLKFDLYYIKHRSFQLDLLILIRTVEIVLFGKGR